MRLFHGAGALALAAALMLAATTGAQAQAFGIREGMPVSDLKVVEDWGDGYYLITPPEPSPLFARYLVQTAPGVGVCSITGIGHTLLNDRTGTKAKERLGVLVAALTARHGEPRVSYDHLPPGALWDGPTEWAASLHQEERTYATGWGPDPELNINAITVRARADNHSDTYVNVTYGFTNLPRCKAYKTAQDTRGL